MIKFAEIVRGSEEKSNPACEVIAIRGQKVVLEWARGTDWYLLHS